jgi:hypothetical protein
VAIAVALIYMGWQFPPILWQDLIVLMPPLFGIILYNSKKLIGQFYLAGPLVAFSAGGALFFPMVSLIHAGEYHILDKAAGLLIVVGVWGLSTYFIQRAYSGSRAKTWNVATDRFEKDWRRWLVIILTPIIWAGNGYTGFALVDIQFDTTRGEIFRTTTLAKRKQWSRRIGYMYYTTLVPWLAEYRRRPMAGETQVPSTIYDGLSVGQPACVTQHPGFLGARWYWVDACRPLR